MHGSLTELATLKNLESRCISLENPTGAKVVSKAL